MAYHASRIPRLAILFFLLLILLLGRLVYLQIIDGSHLAQKALTGRMQEVPIEIARGEILDRSGVPLTNTAQHFSLVVFPGQVVNRQQTVAVLAELTGIDPSRIAARFDPEDRPFKLKTDMDAMSAHKVNQLRLPGVIAVGERVRYGYSSLASHLVGYINRADNKGVSGVEGLYDDILRGNQTSYVAALVDASQRLIPGLGYKRVKLDEGEGPSNVVLTIDSRVQKAVEAVMDESLRKGAIVVLRPSTGEILAMASRPNFDGNNLGDYLYGEASPLMNRAVSAYQPGSVFKMAVAAAALEEKVVTPQDTFYDAGYIDVNGLRIKGWDFAQGPRGRLTFTEAMAYSSNPVFIEVALKLGADRLVSYARKLGFGQRTRLGLAGEADGNLPTADILYPGDLANLAIGQGMLEATPLQMAGVVATLVNDGVKVDPYLVSRLTTPAGVIIKTFPVSRGQRVLSRQTAQEVRDMMKAVTTYGTGQAAYFKDGGSAGKTGSAETGRSGTQGKGISHAWFAGYAPLDNPQYVVVVFVEDGMSGGDVAAPIFHDIVDRIMANG